MTEQQIEFLNYFRDLQYDGRYPALAYNVTYNILCSSYDERTTIKPENPFDFLNTLSYYNRKWFTQFKFPIVTDFSMDRSQFSILKDLLDVIGKKLESTHNIDEIELFDDLYQILEKDEDYGDVLFEEIVPFICSKIVICYNNTGDRLVVMGRAYGDKVICVVEHQEKSIFNDDFMVWVNTENRYLGNIWDICNQLKDRFPVLSTQATIKPV